MLAYRNEVWDFFSNFFVEHEISFIPREKNGIADALSTVASTFKASLYSNEKYEINVKHWPSIPNNTNHWRFFEDDQQIRRFMERTNEFLSTPIERHEDDIADENYEIVVYLNVVAGKKIIHLSNNLIPKGLVSLERLFDSNDVALKPRILPIEGQMENYNLGTESDPKVFKVSSSLKKE